MKILLAAVILLCMGNPLGLFAQAPGAGYCVGFNGTNQYISASSLTSYHVDTDFTVEAWIFAYSLNQTQNLLGNFTFNMFGAPQGFALQLTANGNLALQTSGGIFTSSPAQISNSTWYHVAMVCQGANLLFYINGELAATVANVTPTTATTQPFYLGRAGVINQPGYFNGELDEVRIWDQALSQTEIRNWMCRKITNVHPNYGSLTGYWRLDNGNGPTATDLSTSGNHGVLNNSPMWGWSGAPIGDLAIHTTPGALPISALNFNGDTLWLDSAYGNPTRIYAYQVNEAPNFSAPPNGFSALDTTHYYGLFFVDGASPHVSGRFTFAGSPFLTGTSACNVMLAVRPAGNYQFWSSGTGTPNDPARSLLLQYYPHVQMIPGIRPHPHIAVAIPSDTACVGDSILLTTTSGADLYIWQWNGFHIPGGVGLNYYATSNGTYTVESRQDGCIYDSNPIHVFFHPSPTSSLTLPTYACYDEPPITLSGGLPVGGIYSGPGVSGNIFDPIASGFGPKTITYTFTSPNGCSSTSQTTIQVQNAPLAQLTAPQDHCQLAGPITLSTGLPFGGVYGGFGVTGNQFDPQVTGAGTWQIEYVVTAWNGCDDTAYAFINILAPPITPTISVAGNTLFSSSPTGNQWYDQNGLIPGATGQTYTPTQSGTFYVILTDGNGCESEPSLPFQLTVSITPGLRATAIKIFPQPASTSVTVEWMDSGDGEVNVALYDPIGRVVWQQEIASFGGPQRLEVPMQGLAEGVYLLRIGDSALLKVIKAD